ncbi:MAG: (d)CMP kinase, partial [Bacteroidota bacterium]|nr:(d)CMP kinase [Bacteroidota bacterium]
ERARRRQKDLAYEGIQVSIAELVKQIGERDQKDSKRNTSPLRKADDALILDTSDLTMKEQVDFIVKRAVEILSE